MKYLRNNKSLKISVYILVGLVVLMSVGYAAFSTVLNINGTSHVKGARWSIHYVQDSLTILSDTTDGFTNITGDSVTTPATINTDLNSISFEIDMNSQTKYEFTVDVTNDGSYDGLVKTVLLTTTKGADTPVETYDNTYTDGSVTYEVTYIDGTPIEVGDALSIGETKTLKFKAWYLPVSGSAPTEDTDYLFSTSVEYTQSSGLAEGEEVSVPYRITFINNGGTSTITSKYVNRGEAIGSLPSPTKTGLAFRGWYSDEALTNKIDESYIPTSNMNLYAKYGGKYVITINAENSKTVSADTMYISYGDSIGTFPTITYKGGFVADGWYSDSSYTTAIDTTYHPTGDMTIYAKSKINETLGIYYFFNNYKFLSTGTDNILLVKDNIGSNVTYNQANTSAQSFMPTYNSRLMSEAEGHVGFSLTSGFVNNTDWWLGNNGYITSTGAFGSSLSSSNTYGIRPVISLAGVSIKIDDGSGTNEDPYVITLK